jgi:RNase P subunit RPR2
MGVGLMVRVISTQPHPSVVKETICKHCGAVLEYVPVDIKTRKEQDYTGGTDFIHFIICPPCGHKITVK